MNLKILSQNELDGRLKGLVKKERELLHEILLTVLEIRRREIYFDFGYASLFLYLTEEIKYSKGSAQRRIDAAMLLNEIPGLGEKIESGEINLGQMTLVQKAVRDVSKKSDKVVTAEDKSELIEQIVHKDHFQSEQEVAAFFDLPVIQRTTLKPQADESVRLSLTLSKTLYENIKPAQALLSHALKDSEITTYLDYVTNRVIKQKTSVRTPAETAEKQAQKVSMKSQSEVPNGTMEEYAESKPTDKSTRNQVPSGTSVQSVSTQGVDSTSALPKNQSLRTSPQEKPTAFRQQTRKIILKQQPCCQYVDPVTDRACQSQWFLQTDHRQPRWAGGEPEIENAQVLCAAHNRYKYRKEAGIRRV